MASLIQLVHLDMSGNQIQNVAFQTLATPPSNPALGQFYYNTADKTPYTWDGTIWKDMGHMYVHPTYNTGDVLPSDLIGAKVISNVEVENGHVVNVETRDLTPANIGAAPASHTHTTAQVTALTDYSLGTDTPIEANDSLNVALGKLQKQVEGKTNNTGTVTSVGIAVPTGFSVVGSPVTSSGNVQFAYASGYQGFTTAESTKLAGIQANANNYVLPTATPTVKGGVKVGTNLTVDANDVLHANFTETDPVYTASIPNQMMIKANIMENADLNTYTVAGVYICNTNNNAVTVLNKPDILTTAFSLEVMRSSSTMIFQRITDHAKNKIYVRNWTGTSWTSWRDFVYSSDLNNYIPTSHPVNGITSTNIANWNTAYGWGNFRDFGLGANAIDVANSNQIGLSGRFYKMEGSATGNTLGTGGFLNIPNSATSSMILKLNNIEASVGSLDANGVMTKRYDLWNSLNLTAGTLSSLNTVGETVDKIWSSKNLNDWLNSKNYANASQLANYIPTSHVVNNITATDIGNWNAAYGWGTHIGKYLSLTGGVVTGNVRLFSGSGTSIPASGSAITNHALSIGTPTNGMQIGSLANGQGYIQQTRIDGTATNYTLNLNPNGGQVAIGSGGLLAGGTIQFSGLGAGFVKSSANGTLSIDTNTYATSTDLSNRIPYTGADKDIDFGTQTITHNGIKRDNSSIESPWITASPTSTNKVVWIVVDNLTPINTNRQFIIEVESISGNGNVLQLKKQISLWLTNTNIITSLNEKFVNVLGAETNEKRFTIGTPERHSDTAIKVPIIWISSSPQTRNKITLKTVGGTPLNNITFSTLNDAESTLVGVAPRNTEDNYIGVDNEQLGLSGNKKTSGQWSFMNRVNVGTDTSDAQLTIVGTQYADAGTAFRQLSLSNNIGNQKLWLSAIGNSGGTYIMSNAGYYNANAYTPNHTSASGVVMKPDGSIDFVANTGLTVGTNYTPTSRLRIGNDGKVTIADLTGTGTRMVVASSTGVLSTQAIPSAQVLSLGTSPGNIILNGGGGNVSLDTLKTSIRNDSNLREMYQGFRPYMTAADNIGYPLGITHGSGLRLERSSGSNSTGFDIYSPSSSPDLYYKTFSGVDTETAWKIIADREWVTAENFLKTVNLGYTATATNGVITNTGGTNSTIPAATSSMAGLMLPTEKTKLNNIEANANNYLHPTANPGTHPFATELTSGLQVLSQLVVNNEGHVVTVKGRNLTAADLASVMINNASTTATNQTWSASKINAELQAAIASAQTGALQYKGDYNPATNTPAITTDATVKTGFTYVVTATGTFAGQAVEAGDMIIAKINNPGATAANWQIVNKNIPAIVTATTAVAGIIQLATNAEAIAGTNATKAITPATLKAAMDAAVGGYSIAFGNGSSINFDISHGLNTQFVTVMIYRASDMRQVLMQVAPTSASVVNVQCNTAPSNNQYIIVIKK